MVLDEGSVAGGDAGRYWPQGRRKGTGRERQRIVAGPGKLWAELTRLGRGVVAALAKRFW